MTRAETIAQLLEACPFSYVSEAELQQGIAEVLSREGIAFEREVVLSPGCRIDFLVEDLGIEVKCKGGFAEVARQLYRYASESRIGGLLLATTRMQLGCGLPERMQGKAIRVARLSGGIF